VPIDQDAFRSALGRFASGVTVLTTRDATGKDYGMTVSAFCSASLVPPLVLVCIDRAADSHDALKHATHFGVSILAEGQEALARRFSTVPSGRFDGVGYTRGESGVLLLDDAIGHLECTRLERFDAGDHSVYLGEVERCHTRNDRPLLYYRGGYAQLER
jgi:flavin reductase (DIM6/NTAB) family NADH-FMN oxidoreductase RutF